MFLAVSAARLLSVLACLRGVSMSGMSVMRGLLVTSTFVMLRSLLVVLRSMGVMFGCFAVVVGSFF